MSQKTQLCLALFHSNTVLSLQNQVTSKISKLFLYLPGLACRVLQLGPVDAQFLGKVAIEVPYVASLKNGVREIAILKVK